MEILACLELRSQDAILVGHQEIAGGYLWSPTRNANDARNPFYESMREVSPGDLISSFADTR
jgi:hypothetical protein